MNELSVKDLILEHNHAAKTYTLTFSGQGKVALRTNLGWLNHASFVISNDQYNRSILVEQISKYIDTAEYVPAFNDMDNELAVAYAKEEAKNTSIHETVGRMFADLTKQASTCLHHQEIRITLGEAVWSLSSNEAPAECGSTVVCLDNSVVSLHLNFNKHITVYEMIQPITENELEDDELMKRMDLIDNLRGDTFSKDDLSNTVAIYRLDRMYIPQRVEVAIKFARYHPEQSFIILDSGIPLKGGLDRSDESMAKFKEDGYGNLIFAQTSGLSL